jgi:choice-of-anchor B domain-containing protein
MISRTTTFAYPRNHVRFWALLVGLLLLVVILSQHTAALKPSVIACVDGMAGQYPCHNVHLLAHLSLEEMGADIPHVHGNDHWGWTDPQTGRDYVLFGLTNATAFVDITDREHPRYLGQLPGHDPLHSEYRDIQVYENYAYITADIPTLSGLQVFDLTQLRNVINPPVVFAETNHYAGFGAGHTLWINQASAYLYVFRSDSCGGEVHMVDLQDPSNPAFAGCFEAEDAPLSEGECLIYDGPDAAYHGRELCFIGSDDNVSIGDVTDKSAPVQIATEIYDGISRAHQGMLAADRHYWVLSDIEDEERLGNNTRTHLFDVSDVDDPIYLGYYEHPTTATDHNLYIVGDLVFQANWQAGLRILNIAGLPNTALAEVGYFDIVPGGESHAHAGAFSNYPFWGDGVVTVSGSQEGLFILQFRPPVHLPLIAGN